MKDIVKIVHLPSVVQSEFYEATKILFVCKKNKIIIIYSIICLLCVIVEPLRLNHWWQMDYSDDVFHTFLGLDCVIYLAVNGTVTSLPVLSKISSIVFRRWKKL